MVGYRWLGVYISSSHLPFVLKRKGFGLKLQQAPPCAGFFGALSFSMFCDLGRRSQVNTFKGLKWRNVTNFRGFHQNSDCSHESPPSSPPLFIFQFFKLHIRDYSSIKKLNGVSEPPLDGTRGRLQPTVPVRGQDSGANGVSSFWVQLWLVGGVRTRVDVLYSPLA